MIKKYITNLNEQRDVATVYGYVDISFLGLYFHDTYVFIARNSYTKSYHVTVSSSESSHRRAIKGLPEYCNAQKTVESKERLRLPEKKKKIR